jgi:hypothetical protein
MFFVAYYIAQELSEFTINKSEYLQDGWNIIDWLNLLLLIAVVVYRVYIYMGAGGTVFSQMANKGQFTDLSEFAWYITEIRSLNAFNSILIWVKTLKYVPFIPYVTIMMKTIKYSWRFFVSFTVIAFCIFMGFSIGFTGGFGDKIEKVNSLDKTTLFLCLSFVGSAFFGDFTEQSPIFGGILVVMFLVLVYFVLLNLFMAIMVVALSEARANEMENKAVALAAEKSKKKKSMVQQMWDMLEIEEFIRTSALLKGLHARREH